MYTDFYNSSGKRITFHIGSYFDYGGNAKIYRIDNNTCLKWFNESTYCNEMVFKLITKMHLNGFYNIYDMLYNEEGNFVGYTMEYYNKENIDILTMPSEYTINNIYKLYYSIQSLNKQGIVINDLHDRNVILRKKDIIIIDVDMYKFYNKNSNQRIEYMNLCSLNTLFRYLYDYSLENISKTYNDYATGKKVIAELFQGDTDIFDVHRKLLKYKYPIDYIKETSSKLCL